MAERVFVFNETQNVACRSCGRVDFLMDGLCRVCFDAQDFDPIDRLFLLEGLHPRVGCPICQMVVRAWR